MTQKDMALGAANDLFKSIVGDVFKALDTNLLLAKDDAARKEAVEKARKGLVAAQGTLSACLTLADTLQ